MYTVHPGLLCETSGKDLNPWMRSSQFNKQQDFLRPGTHNPDVGGSSIRLSNPSSHELYVAHCRNCVGIMTMVYSWNSAGASLLIYVLIQILRTLYNHASFTFDSHNTVETALVHKDIGESMETEIKVCNLSII